MKTFWAGRTSIAEASTSLLRNRIARTKPSLSANASDLFVLLCFFSLIVVSITLVVLVFVGQALRSHQPPVGMSILQRLVSGLSVPITSAAMMIVGKWYTLSRLTRGGIRCRRIAVYSNPSINNIANYVLQFGRELPLLGLLAVWILGLSTALTVHDISKLVPIVLHKSLWLPVGPLNSTVRSVPLVDIASSELALVASSLCMKRGGAAGLVNVTGTRLEPGGQSGSVYYPPLQSLFDLIVPIRNVTASVGSINAFEISVDEPSSLPPGSQNITQCVDSGQLYLANADNQTLSLIVTPGAGMSAGLYRFNASAVIAGGTLAYSRPHAEFALDGTATPNVMPNNRWALDIVNVICNTTIPSIGSCSGSAQSIVGIAKFVTSRDSKWTTDGSNTVRIWTTVLGMVMGGYSSAVASQWTKDSVIYRDAHEHAPAALVTLDAVRLVVNYGVYVLIANIVASIALLVAASFLFKATDLGADFMHPTRLMLDPLKKPGLFDAPLDDTIDALKNPYLLVSEDKELLILNEERSFID